MPSSARAHTTATSAMLPLVIQVFSPLSTQPSPSRRAVVRMPAGFDPKSGSVRPKHPTAFPLCSGGSHFCFCCSLPNQKMGYITSAPCTETKLRTPESTRSSSCMTSPYSTLLMPAQP